MIYSSDDYITKYCDTIAYIIGRSYSEKYSFDVIQKRLSYSSMINQLERSNPTLLAFDSMEKNYFSIFPELTNNYVFSPYDVFGWMGQIYIHLFLAKQVTFEALFYLLPISRLMSMYPIYHEMSVSQIDDYLNEQYKYTMLDIIMKDRKISNNQLSKLTNISISTINALRYNVRDISKLEAQKLLTIAQSLDVKIETLLPSINLKIID